MKITDIKLFTVEIPVLTLEQGGIAPYVGIGDEEAGTIGGTSYALSNIFKVETDEGISGWGEMNPIISLNINRMFLEEFIKPAFVGADPFLVRRIMDRFAGVYNPQINPKTFITGVEIACWDIMGKATGRSVCDLLGGAVRDRTKIAYCLGMLGPKETEEKVKQIKSEGYKCIKSKGGKNFREDIERTWIIRHAGGPDLEVRMDVNQAYDNITALEYLHAVRDADLQYIEQPLPINRFSDMKILRHRTCVPIAINEDCYLPGNVFELIRQRAIDAAVVDMEQLGGISDLVHLSAVALEAGLPLAHHCGFDMGIKTAAIVQATCACPSFTYATDSTYHVHADDILVDRIKVEDGHFLLPDGPGLGVGVDEEKLEFYAVRDTSRTFL